MSFIITYDLNSLGQNYQDLERAIKAYGTYKKIATTTYIIVTNESSSEIRDYLKQYIDSNDELFVGKLSGQGAWTGLSNDISNWLKQNL